MYLLNKRRGRQRHKTR